MVDTEDRCEHPGKHSYRSPEDCRALKSLEGGIWSFSTDFLEESNSSGEIFTNRYDYQRVMEYAERLEHLLVLRTQALQIVSAFVGTPPSSPSPIPKQEEQESEEHLGQSAAREHLFELIRPHLDVLSEERLEKPSLLDADQDVSRDQCRPVIEHIEQLETMLRASDTALEIVSEFIGERAALQKEQYVVAMAGTQRSDEKRRVLQGKINARKALSQQLTVSNRPR